MYVGSYALHQTANIKGPFLSDSVYLNPSDYENIQENSGINVCPQALPTFVRNIRPKIKTHFKLITNNSDATLPEDYTVECNAILNNSLLINWYSQNWTQSHPKVTRIPIGLDYHTLTPKAKKYVWSPPERHPWGLKRSPTEQEAFLQSLRMKASPLVNRQIKAYANFHFLMTTRYGKVDRVNALSTVPKDIVFYEPTHTTRDNCWNNMIQYAFVISPQGNGLDCHRTWEALALGCIPIIKSSGIDSLFDELPVWIVNDWSEVTQDKMRKKIEEFRENSFNYEKLTLQYWKSKIINI